MSTESGTAEERGDRGRNGATPALEWISATIGLLITLAMLGFIGWQAWTDSEARPPAIELRVERVLAAAGGWVVEVVAENLSTAAAAGVVIEGELSDGGDVVATSQATFDYVPGRSERRGGLFFDEDPALHRLDLRALGYAEP